MKNIDRIRQMNSEELAEQLANTCLMCVFYKGDIMFCDDENCEYGIRQYLEQEVEE